MAGEGIGLDGLSEPVIDRYLAERRAAGYVEYRSPKALRPLLDYLDAAGGAPGSGGGRARFGRGSCWAATAATWSVSVA